MRIPYLRKPAVAAASIAAVLLAGTVANAASADAEAGADRSPAASAGTGRNGASGGGARTGAAAGQTSGTRSADGGTDGTNGAQTAASSGMLDADTPAPPRPQRARPIERVLDPDADTAAAPARPAGSTATNDTVGTDTTGTGAAARSTAAGGTTSTGTTSTGATGVGATGVGTTGVGTAPTGAGTGPTAAGTAAAAGSANVTSASGGGRADGSKRRRSSASNVARGTAAPGGGTAKTLILYDSTGPWGWLGEVYATQTANLSSRFGSWTAHPVAGYTDNELDAYTAVIYVGSTYDEPLPTDFLDDVTATGKQVLWIYDNIWQLTARDPDFAARRGFTWKQFDFSTVAEVRYHGASLTRDTVNGSGIMDTAVSDPARAVPVAEAVRADGSTLPWGVRSGNFTYLGEVPFAYVGHDDRYLALADLLFDVLAPAGTGQAAGQRHRALVRIEDVGPDADPAELRAVADYLYSRRVPFTVAVYPRYRNPRGVDNDGRPEDYTLRQRPAVVSALKYMQARGGTLLMHGYTHQYESLVNPYDSVSANDFEFFTAHVDASDAVVYDGPVPSDSAWWAMQRVGASATEFVRAGLPVPQVFEFPHYAGSATDYRVVDSLVGTRYDRGLYFPGVLSGGTVDHSRLSGQFFPYPVRDVYGSVVVPENIGNVEPEPFNNHPARLPADLLASARRNLVVRDGVASFFYHPYLGTGYLRQVVEGVQALGYTFVPASAITRS